jgi:hypothetical protein
MSRAALPAALLLTSASLTACLGGSVRSATKNAVPVVVDETLTSFEDPKNRERFEQIIASPEMQRAIQDTARALVAGALEPGTDLNAQSVTDSMADILARDIKDRILPATVAGLRESLRTSFTSEDEQALLRAIDSAVTRATTSAIRAASAELPKSLAPAVQGVLVQSLSAPELHTALAGITADATRTALVSSRDVITQMREESEEKGPVFQLVDHVQRMLERVMVITFLLGAALGSVIVWASRYVRRRGPSEPTGPVHLDRPPARAT